MQFAEFQSLQKFSKFGEYREFYKVILTSVLKSLLQLFKISILNPVGFQIYDSLHLRLKDQGKFSGEIKIEHFQKTGKFGVFKFWMRISWKIGFE